MVSDPQSVLETAAALANLATKIMDFVRTLGERRPQRRRDAEDELAMLIELQTRIQAAHQAALDDLGAAIDANSRALTNLRRSLDRRTKTLSAFLAKVQTSDIEDRDELARAIRRELANGKGQQRLLESQQNLLTLHLETMQKQAEEIARVSRQLDALMTLMDLRFGGQG